MSEKDVVSKELLNDEENVADLLNVCYFHGKQVVQATDVHELNQTNSISKKVSNTAKSITIHRDANYKTDFEMTATIIALELQSEVHYAMPVRVMTGDTSHYYGQWRKIERIYKKAYKKKNKNRSVTEEEIPEGITLEVKMQKKKLSRAEYLSGFSKEDRLTPVITLVLYFGREVWDGPRTLKDMLDLEGVPAEISDVIVDYPIYVIDVRRYKDYELFRTDLRWVFGFLQRDTDKDALRKYILENQTAFENLSEDAFDVICEFSYVKELKKRKSTYNIGKGSVDMCQAIKDMMEESKQEGRLEGRQEGRLEGRQEGKLEGKQISQCNTIRNVQSLMNATDIVRIFKYSEDFVLAVIRLLQKNAQSTDEEIVEMIRKGNII